MTLCPVVSAQSNDIPAWEIGLAAGSGSLALFLCLFAIYSFRQNNTVKNDVESGLRTGQTTRGTRPPPARSSERPGGPGVRPRVTGSNSSRSNAPNVRPSVPPRGANSVPTKKGTRPTPRPTHNTLDRMNAKVDKSVDTSNAIISALGDIAVKTVSVADRVKSGANEIGATAVSTVKRVSTSLKDDKDRKQPSSVAKKAADMSAKAKERHIGVSQAAKPRSAVANRV